MRRLLCLFAIVAASCSPHDGIDDNSRAQPEVTGSDDAATAPRSVGLVRIGPAAYDLTFTCVDRGAAEVLAVGVGTDVNNKPVQAFVQAFVGEPYIGVSVGDGDDRVLFEPRLGVLLDFTFDHDVVRFDAVDFVTELDFETGEYTPAGLGSAVVECRSYETGNPDRADLR